MGLLNSSSATSMNGGVGMGPLNSTAYMENDKTLSSYMMSQQQHGTSHTLTGNVLNGTVNTGVSHVALNGNNLQSHGVVRNNTLSNINQLANSAIFTPQIRMKHTGDFLGYLEWKTEDEALIIKRLVDGSYLNPCFIIKF
jgi:hypothetical protein